MPTSELVSLSAHDVALVRAAVYYGVASIDDGRRENDDLPTTVHCGIRVDAQIVSVGTVNRDPSPRNDHVPVWRIRGMATLPDHQSRGYGAAVLRYLMDHIKTHGGGLLWGDLRVNAVPFYERYGFVVQQDTYTPRPGGTLHRYGEVLIPTSPLS
jgi:GNAT superfamily N-acetyltransferase